jgi:hypothetical protein
MTVTSGQYGSLLFRRSPEARVAKLSKQISMNDFARQLEEHGFFVRGKGYKDSLIRVRRFTGNKIQWKNRNRWVQTGSGKPVGDT